MSEFTLPVLSDDARKALKADAAHARKDATLDAATAPFWDAVVAANSASDTKRADVVRAVLTALGEWRNTPQKADGVRTPFGNTVQRFAARYDAAVKRVNDPGETAPKATPDYLALAARAAKTARDKGAYDADAILAAITDALMTA